MIDTETVTIILQSATFIATTTVQERYCPPKSTTEKVTDIGAKRQWLKSNSLKQIANDCEIEIWSRSN